ncbi:uncharacterized protein PADG_02344 [Paracoccidioides brasiliensis Pb18]|uniref:Uncharacterized protein n=1 Tax=Paracoccidioides brasiliensis (strain Pb18) TaxID=502780 RepID=C1G2H8_PARBD|nr:uncharacterized protein PADG_02344 [Paracoccidioides brasiliensis Pb18]EEH46194.2 hypothetical protein PADG_02344 [Paracoccidioides brasiliensis Pb18]
MVISYLRRLPGDYREPSIFLDAKSSWTFWGPEICMSCQRAMPEQHGPVFPSAEQQPPTQPL